MTNNRCDLLFVTHRHVVSGGAELALLEMLEYLKKKEFKSHVIVGAEASFSDKLKSLGIPYSIIGQPYWVHGPEDDSPFVYSASNPRINPTAQTVKLIQSLRPKLCVTNTITIPWLAYASSMTDTPHAWMVHELGTDGLKLQYHLGEEQTLRTIDHLSDAIFFNSPYAQRYYAKKMHSVKNTGIVFPGGAPKSPQSIESPFHDSTLKIVIVGQIKPQKGQLDAVKSIKRLKDKGYSVQIAIIGGTEDQEYMNDLSSYVQQADLENQVIFLGHQANPSSHIAQADLVLVCATNEAFGRVTVESMMLRKPVIAAASAGTLDIIIDGENGVLYDPGNVHDLTSKIISLANDIKLRNTIARKGYSSAKKRYSDDNRYIEFVKYIAKPSIQKTSLNLLPLGSLANDYNDSVGHLGRVETQMQHIERSRAWRALRKIMRLIRGRG